MAEQNSNLMAGATGAVEARTVILFPAIDLKDGACVRLRRGEMSDATIFNSDPGAQAAAFIDQGFDWIHVVDLNGAFAGESRNGEAVGRILSAVAATRRVAGRSVAVQLGGGLRDMAGIESWLARGIERVILGTAAVRDPELVRTACRAFPGRIVVGIDARDGLVAVAGWAEQSTLAASELARRFEDAGVAAIVFTEISRDGMLAGLDLAQTARLAAVTSIPVIASGGFASMRDVEALLRPEHDRLAGAIMGRALYDGRIDAAAALALVRAAIGPGRR